MLWHSTSKLLQMKQEVTEAERQLEEKKKEVKRRLTATEERHKTLEKKKEIVRRERERERERGVKLVLIITTVKKGKQKVQLERINPIPSLPPAFPLSPNFIIF